MNGYKRVVAEIDLDAIAHNIQEIRRKIKRYTEIMAVVKADAYGHGAIEVSKTLLDNGTSRLGVAILEEGKQLREEGIQVPILILGYTPTCQAQEVVQYNLIQTVFTYEMARAISDAASKINKTAKIHIKIDTGMGRLGFPPNQNTIQEVQKISLLPHIEVEGMFTHFPSADEADKEFTNHQIEMFTEFDQKLQNNGIYIPIKHAANSAGVIDFEDAHMNLIRPGLIIYGLYPSADVQKERLDLKPALALKTHISYLKEVEKGCPISYGRTFVTEKKSKIATIPVGYADGYSRRLSGAGRVLINGTYAPIVGRICMDQFMVDVSHIHDVTMESEVVLIGTQGTKSISAEEIGAIIGTINYEVICMIGKRIPRVYMKNQQQIKTIYYL